MRLLLLAVVVAFLFGGLACEEEEPEVTSPQPPAPTAPQTAGRQPATPLPFSEPTVPATVPPEPTGIPWEEAINHIGEWATVCGPVPYAHYWSGDRGQPTFVAVGRSFLDPEHFTVLIWGDDRGKFPTAPEDFYLGETVCVTGWIEPYREAAQMTVASPEDIVILAAPGASPPTAASATLQVAMTREPQPIASPAPPDFGPFIGGWGRHGFGMTVSAGGEATASWRVYKWCSEDPTPPCDAMVDNEIIDGGRAFVVFTRVAGDTLYGWVKESTDEEALAGRVALTLQPYGMGLLEPIGNELYDYEIALCGPNYWQEAPEWLKEQSPCGA